MQVSPETQVLENSTRMLSIFQSSDHNGLFSFKEKYHNHFLPEVKSLHLKKKKSTHIFNLPKNVFLQAGFQPFLRLGSLLSAQRESPRS